jgi:DNA polymerase I-like protein with 3'-5' exonuclease and polymerase domains
MRKTKLQPTRLDAYKLIHDGCLALTRAEQHGMRIDVEYCERKKTHLTRKIARIEDNLGTTDLVKQWKKMTGQSFNLDSNHQLGKVLYDVLGIKPPKKTASGSGATDEDALSQIDLPELKDILRIRKLRKVRDTYLDAFVREQVDGWLHPFFNLHTVRTFRSSSSDPNFQNIPKRDKEAMNICRRAIFPREGHQLIEVDFSGLEVSIATCYHKDPTMMKYLKDPDSDMHGDMASQIFIIDDFDKKKHPEHKFLRNATKNSFVFPQFYGDYYANNAQGFCNSWLHLPINRRWKAGVGVDMPEGKTIGDHLISKGIKGYQDFEDHMKKIENDFWSRRFYIYQKWKDSWVSAYQKRGWFDMYTGFRCSGIMKKNEVINYPVQGAAFHCLLWSFIQLDKILTGHYKSRLIGQIHDAVILDVHPDELEEVAHIIKKVTCKDLPKAWPWIIVPLDVEADLCPVDGSWNMKETYKLPEVQNK